MVYFVNLHYFVIEIWLFDTRWVRDQKIKSFVEKGYFWKKEKDFQAFYCCGELDWRMKEDFHIMDLIDEQMGFNCWLNGFLDQNVKFYLGRGHFGLFRGCALINLWNIHWSLISFDGMLSWIRRILMVQIKGRLWIFFKGQNGLYWDILRIDDRWVGQQLVKPNDKQIMRFTVTVWEQKITILHDYLGQFGPCDCYGSKTQQWGFFGLFRVQLLVIEMDRYYAVRIF